jgi:hypothetical protein
MADGEEEVGIPQFISPDELLPPPATSKPPSTPVVDAATLAQAVKELKPREYTDGRVKLSNLLNAEQPSL